MTRSVPSWIGKTDDAKVPKAVRLRVFAAHGGRCYLSGRLIRPGEAWDLEHRVPLSMGGKHEEQNLAPALVAPHREKTAKEATARAKADRVRLKHIGAFPKSKARIQSRGFQKTRPPLREGGVMGTGSGRSRRAEDGGLCMAPYEQKGPQGPNT